MNLFLQEQSVLVLDNCQIHHNKALLDLVNGAGEYLYQCLILTALTGISAGCLLLFLPPYSPDLNPIEESFSTHTFVHFFDCITFLIHKFYSQSLYASSWCRNACSGGPSSVPAWSLWMHHKWDGMRMVSSCRVHMSIMYRVLLCK